MFSKHFPINLPDRETEISIWGLACMHIGSRGFAEEECRETVEEIRADPNAYYIGMGDWLDLVGPSDKVRWSVNSESVKYSQNERSNLVGTQMRNLRELLEPILNKEKCIGMLIGNHEWKWVKYHHYNPMRDLAQEVGCHYLGMCSHLVLTLRDQKSRKYGDPIRIFVHHGKGNSTTVTGALNMAKAFVTGHDATVYLIAHVHKAVSYAWDLIGTDDPVEGQDDVGLRGIHKLCATTGGYLLSYPEGDPGYAEEKGYEPVQCGSTRITMQYKKKRGKYRIKYRAVV